MDLTEAFAPGGGNEDLEKTDFFDFVVSPPPPQHCTSADGISDEESLLHRTTTTTTSTCRTLDFLHDRQLNIGEDHDQRELHGTSFIKETNNNTLTALPPVSTITSSLSHHHHHHHHHHQVRNHDCGNIQNDQISMDQSDCDYWSTAAVDDDNKESACNILLEDLNKYCWSAHTNSHHQSLSGQTADNIDVNPVNDSVLIRPCSANNDRQNTDGAIYTLTVLNNETDSMDALDCCKSPVPTVSDSWSLRPNLDLDAILNLEPASVPERQQQQDHDRGGLDGSMNSERFHTISATPSQYSAEDSGFVESKDMCGGGVTGGRSQSNGLGDNNNDWKLSDQNHLNEVQQQVAVSAANVSSADSAESLLRSALQGKLYTGSTQVVSSSSQANSTMSLTATSNASSTLQIITDHHQQQQEQHHQQESQQSEDEIINTCTDEDLILSQLDAPTYRPGDYEKLKSIANEVVESYCSLEPVCNVSATTTVMYTLDPSSGSLGTITLPADLGQVGTVTVVTASSLAQQEMLQQAVTQTEIDQQQQVTSNQISNTRIVSGGGGSSGNSTTKSGKKYCRRKNNNSSSPSGTNSNVSSLLSSSSGNSTSSNTSSSQQQSTGSGGSPSSVQRKERSLHYCSICSKGFKDKYSVNVHIRTHTGEKPFACSLCGKSFRQKAHLAKHYQTHVAQKPNVANSNNSNTIGNSSNTNSNSSSADMSTGRTQPQLVPTVATTCNPSN